MEHSILLISKKNKTTPTKGSQHIVSIKVIKPDPNQGVIVNFVNPLNHAAQPRFKHAC